MKTGAHGIANQIHDLSPPSAGSGEGEEISDLEVLVAPEVARLLRMNVKTLYELAKTGALPCWRLGRHFRFSRRAIVAHLGQCKAAPYREGK